MMNLALAGDVTTLGELETLIEHARRAGAGDDTTVTAGGTTKKVTAVFAVIDNSTPAGSAGEQNGESE